ncbi:ferritin-like domain-containing protein [Parapedomonas caeni]
MLATAPAADGEPPRSIAGAAVNVLMTAGAADKAALSRRHAAAWRAGALTAAFDVQPPDRPARPARPELLPPNRMPKRGKAGSEAARFALLHALAHIELNAIDLAWDMVARFGDGMPRAFVDDWVKVADDEALHFSLLAERLAVLGGGYGDLPAHDGLWDAARATRETLLGRLAIVPMVLEARGLDVTPQTIERLRKAGDDESAAILERIYTDEITHVAAGVRWFNHLCESADGDSQAMFHAAVRQFFRGDLKPPFNDSARLQAGMMSGFYHPLA